MCNKRVLSELKSSFVIIIVKKRAFLTQLPKLGGNPSFVTLLHWMAHEWILQLQVFLELSKKVLENVIRDSLCTTSASVYLFNILRSYLKEADRSNSMTTC